jgi:hypothetical protein
MTVLEEIAAEHAKRIDRPTIEFDNLQRSGQLAGAAACYLMKGLDIQSVDLSHRVNALVRDLWPWARHYWRPSSLRQNLIHAAAYVVAEIQRLDWEDLRKAPTPIVVTPIQITAPTVLSLREAGYEVIAELAEPEDIGITADDTSDGSALIAAWNPSMPLGDGWVLHYKGWTESDSISAVWARPEQAASPA